MTSKFLNTPFASWLKVAISAILGYSLVVINDPEQIFFSFETLKGMGIVCSTAVFPMIINYLNQADPRYGKHKPVEIVDKE